MSDTPHLSRRQFIVRSSALLPLLSVPGLLAACASSSSSAPSSAPATGGPSVAPSVGGSDAFAGKVVRTLTWEGYELRDPKPSYTIQQTNMSANEDPINKRGSYDVSVGIEGIYPALFEADVFQPLNLDKIPNLQLLAPIFATAPLIQKDGKQYGMPYVWASLGATYLDNGGPRPAKLADFLGSKYKGKLGIGDDGNSVIIQVARMLGLGGDNPGLLTSAEMDQVFAALADFKKQSVGIIANPYSEFAGAYARGEIIAAFPDNEPTMLRAQDAGKKVQAFLPPESFSWIDALFIAKDVEATDLIYDFLNTGLSESTQYAIGKHLGWAVTNQKAMARLATEGPLWAKYADAQAIFKTAPNAMWPPVKSDTYVDYAGWLKRWQDFKAS